MNNNKWLIGRRCPRTGLRERVVYTGSRLRIPFGWKVIRRVG